MSASDAFEAELLLLLFNNTNIANYGDATGIRGSSTAGNLYIALHTADPTDTGNQATSEVSYTGYARVAVVRSAAGWTVSGANPAKAVNTSTIAFGPCTAGSATVTYFSIGRDASGAGEILMSGALTSSLAIMAGITPTFAAGQLVATFE